ncbi:MAG: hypothetical protein J0M02_01325 [Planctomycetes bacterium]|nr:hypothetical protein [Planctomycetota bacterium]
MLLEAVDIESLRARWRRICNAFIATAYLNGIDAGSIRVSGTPERLDIETWCSVHLIEGPRMPVILIRSQAHGAGTLTAALDGDDTAVAADIADAVDALRRRRARAIDHDRIVAEQELVEMATSTGWHCDGVGGRMPMTAAFRDALDRIRGRLVRTDRADGDPSAARFAIAIEVGGLTYAQALGALVALRCMQVHGVSTGYGHIVSVEAPIRRSIASGEKMV